jgi:hypothetical protein
MTMSNDVQSETMPWRVIITYLTIIAVVYIYFHIIVKRTGDIVSHVSIQTNSRTPRVLLTGWGIARVLAYVVIGASIPSIHKNMMATSALIECYTFAINGTYSVMNPILSITGYAIGSALSVNPFSASV